MDGAIGRALSSTKFLVFALFMVCTTVMVLLGKLDVERWLKVAETLVPTWLGAQAAVDVARRVKEGMEAKVSKATATAPPADLDKTSKVAALPAPKA